MFRFLTNSLKYNSKKLLDHTFVCERTVKTQPRIPHINNSGANFDSCNSISHKNSFFGKSVGHDLIERQKLTDLTLQEPKVNEIKHCTSSFKVETDDATITFTISENGLKVTIVSGDLVLESIDDSHKQNFYSLYSNPEVMKTFHTGEPKNKEYVDNYFTSSKEAFSSCSPFGAFAMFVKGKDGKLDFVGDMSPDHTGEAHGRGELAYNVLPNHQGHGYAKKAAQLLLDEYIPSAILLGCNLNLRGKEFYEMFATARTDNKPSLNILGRFMHKIKHSEQILYGNERVEFRVSGIALVERFLKHDPKITCSCDENDLTNKVANSL